MGEMVTATATKKILILDTYYQDFLKTLPSPEGSYSSALQDVLDEGFGTADFYSRHLRALQWNAIDVLANDEDLQRLWVKEHGRSSTGLQAMALDQIAYYEPDCVFLQDVSFFSVESLRYLASNYVLAAQISCPMPQKEKVETLKLAITSFPHYVSRFESLGVKAFYVPLAFDDGILNRIEPAERIHDVAFVGGVGRPSHWKAGMEVLGAVAREIPVSRFWGYGYDLLSKDSPIVKNYCGQAFGLDMYTLLAKTRIGLNRHGDIAEGYTNNMRTFEITGMGAMLLTEESKNLSDFFTEKECVSYSSPADAVDKIRYYLSHDDERREIAAAGQARTLRDHTYTVRMKQVSDILNSCLS